MEPSIEMDRLDTSGKIVEIKDIVDKSVIMIDRNKKEILKNQKRMTTIIIPMLGVVILGLGLMIGVFSGYLLRLPHQQTNGEGQVDLQKPGSYTSKSFLQLCCFSTIQSFY